MWRAIERALHLVKPGGRFAIASYNDQGEQSDYWKRIKQGYLRMPKFGGLYVTYFFIWREDIMPRVKYFWFGWFFKEAHKSFLKLRWKWFAVRSWEIIREHVQRYKSMWTDYHEQRGMSRWHDLVDWVGGWPFEVASVAQVTEFFQKNGFKLEASFPAPEGSPSNNEFVFIKAP